MAASRRGRELGRVLLVASNRQRRPYPVPPLGPCLLAESLSRRWEVEVFDGMFEGPDRLRERIEAFCPDVVGLSIRNVEDPVMERHRSYLDDVARRFAEPIRAATRAPLVLGGSGFSIFPRQILDRMRADLGVVGEGESSFPRLLERLEAGGGVSADSEEALVAGEPCSAESVGVEIGPSRLDRWIDFSPYATRSTYPVQTKRGCPRGCVYCVYPKIEGRVFRLRRPEAVADEIEEAVARLGAEVTFEVVDSVFNDPPGHAEAVCEALAGRALGVRLRAMGVSPRGLSAELLGLMRRAGFVQIHCTPDSASPAVLEGLGKGLSRESLESAAIAIREAGLPTMWFMLVGGPGETEETFRETVEFIDRFVAPEDMVDLWLGLRVYPGTPLHDLAVRDRIVSEDDDLFEPRYYVSPALGRARGRDLVEEACAARPNCVPAWESTADEAMMRQALALRARLGADEPMFRTLLRVRRDRMGIKASR